MIKPGFTISGPCGCVLGLGNAQFSIGCVRDRGHKIKVAVDYQVPFVGQDQASVRIAAILE